MSRGAQNAFLKLLEEPNQSTRFILTSHSPSSLLPTVRSRVQEFHIQPIASAQSKEYIKALGVSEPTKQAQLLFLASGLPAELARLVGSTEYFQQQAEIITDARSLMTNDDYQKMRIIQKYRGSREDALRLIDSSIEVLRFSLSAKPQQKIVQQLDRLLQARDDIAANQSVALQLARAVL